MPRAWTTLWIHWVQLLPRSRLDAVLVKVINSIVAIVPSENVDAATMHHCSVPVTRARWLRAAIWIQLTPCVRREVEAEEVVPPVASVIATKNVEIIVQCN